MIVCRANAGARELLLDIIFTTLIIKLPGLYCARGAILLLYLATSNTYSNKEAKAQQEIFNAGTIQAFGGLQTAQRR
jgi:hypothetical protein